MDYFAVERDSAWDHLPLVHNHGVAHLRRGSEVRVGDRMLFGEVVAKFYGPGDAPDYWQHIVIEEGVPVLVGSAFTRRQGSVRGVETRDHRMLAASASQLHDLTEIALGAYPLKLDPEDGRVVGIDVTTADLVAFGKNIERARDARDGRQRQRVNEDRLKRVASVYKANAHYKPVMAVHADLGVSRPYAGELVRRARQAGLLPPTTRGKAKG